MIFFIVFIAIVIPLVAPYEQKRLALYISLMLLFIPWGLQYEMTQDWEPHLLHWNVVNESTSALLESRELEPVYVFWLRLLSPFSYFGYLMICALIELGIIGYLIIKYVAPELYWVSIAILMLCVENGLLMINSNRMTMALIVTIIAVLCLFKHQCSEENEYGDGELENVSDEQNKRGLNIQGLILFFVFFVVAVNIHGGAFAAIGLIIIYVFVLKIKNLNRPFWIILMNLFFLLRFFVDASSLQTLAFLYIGGVELEGFDNYIDEIDIAERISRVYTPIFFIFMNVILLTYHKMTTIMKFFALALIVKIQFHSFLIGSIGRILQFYYIYSIILIPYVIQLMECSEYGIIKKSKRIVCVLSFLLIIYDFIKNVTTDMCYERWPDFHTIFSAPVWL